VNRIVTSSGLRRSSPTPVTTSILPLAAAADPSWTISLLVAAALAAPFAFSRRCDGAAVLDRFDQGWGRATGNNADFRAHHQSERDQDRREALQDRAEQQRS